VGVYRYSVTLTRYRYYILLLLLLLQLWTRGKEKDGRRDEENKRKKKKKGFSIIEFSTTPQVRLTKNISPTTQCCLLFIIFFFRSSKVFCVYVLRIAKFVFSLLLLLIYQTITSTSYCIFACIPTILCPYNITPVK